MNFFNIFTRRSLGLDYKVWIVMIITSLSALGLLGYQLVTNEPCKAWSININGKSVENNNTYLVDQLLTFTVSIDSGSTVIWNFGDNSRTNAGSVVHHKFLAERNYQVSAKINGRCTKVALVRIKGIPPPPPPINIRIIGNSYAVEQATEKYSSNVVADSYQWKLATNNETIQMQNGASAEFTFPASGNYTIELMIDGNAQKTVLKEVTVFQKLEITEPPLGPPPVLMEHPIDKSGNGNKLTPAPDTSESAKEPEKETAEKPPKKDVHPETFKSELDNVIALKKTPEEVADKYLFYGVSTRVKINKEATTKTFIEFCYQMRNTNRYRLASVSFDSDASGITVINVKLVRVSWIRRVLR